MNKYGILAGGGSLPLIISNSLKKNNIKIFIVGIKNNFNLKNISYDYEIVKLGSLTKILKILKKNKVNKLIFAGSIRRPSIKDFSLDFRALKFLNDYQLDKLGDDSLLKAISNYFEKKGFEFVKWKNYCPNLFMNENFPTIKKPSKIAYENLQKGLNIFKYYGKLDIGQSIVVQNKIILGLEAIEGTDDLIKRCYFYKRKGDKGIIIKLKKHKQDIRFDLPTIGINTLKLLKKYQYEGIFIQRKNCLVINKNKVIEFANKNNLFISNIDKF